MNPQLTFCLTMNYLWSFATTKRANFSTQTLLKIFTWSHMPKGPIISLLLNTPGHLCDRSKSKVLNTCSHIVGEVEKKLLTDATVLLNHKNRANRFFWDKGISIFLLTNISLNIPGEGRHKIVVMKAARAMWKTKVNQPVPKAPSLTVK